MGGHRLSDHALSRRTLLKAMAWAPVVFLPAPLRALGAIPQSNSVLGHRSAPLPRFHLAPHYPEKSPLDEVLRKAPPGGDEYITEKYAFEIVGLLEQWGQGLRSELPSPAGLAGFLDAAVEASSLQPIKAIPLRSAHGIEVYRRQFAAQVVSGRDNCLQAVKGYFADMSRIETAEFQLVGIGQVPGSAESLRTRIRYELAGIRRDGRKEQRIGHWLSDWSVHASQGWRMRRWQIAGDETVSRVRGPVFIDVTSAALGQAESYRSQLLLGTDYWRTVLDGACGIDVYGNNGVAVGDFNGDGLDDIYVCQPSGLPNRLYLNRGDGTFEDVTERSGLGVLDATACALFADFENQGRQDLLVVCAGGPLLFANQGNGKFSVRRDAFKFARPAQGTFTHAALADYDGDGFLDVYFCVYSYYQGLEQYRYPVPYFDARNGPPNFLFHNQGDGTFHDRTEAAGLNVDNNRYSFASAWGDCDGNGKPDLYVANDFGRNNLYRNNGDGTFTSISRQAGVEQVAAGMSACWCDFENRGMQDIYAGNMWSAAGLRVSQQNLFHTADSENVRALYRHHAAGNSLYRNRGDGRFENVAGTAGVDVGRWAWSSDAWDFDHDGYSDLYISNGYISGEDTRDLASFFWRQVVGKSPSDSAPSPAYEEGWNAINELIRSDATWNGYEKNVFFLNNHDGTFSDISGVSGLDFPDDSRAFALADLDHDGRPEVVLKNRNGPQLRILHNAMPDLGNAIAFRLRGHKSNRDGIGAAITVEAGGRRQTKYLQAGSGFLSQHSKELFFGVGSVKGSIRATVRWPSGATQVFQSVPVNHRIEVQEGFARFAAKPFAATSSSYAQPAAASAVEQLPSAVETWLIQPLKAPEFTLPDLAGEMRALNTFMDDYVLLVFWTMSSQASLRQVRMLQQGLAALSARNARPVGIYVDQDRDAEVMKAFVAREKVSFPILLGDDRVAGVYDIFYRYLFERRRDLPIPATFLLDKARNIVKLYQGPVSAERLQADLQSMPNTAEERLRKALPFGGTLYQGGLRRNDFTYGVALFQRGYLRQATAAFQQVVASKPNNAEAFYNLGTLYLRRHDLQAARPCLERALELRPDYPEAWNNLGMIAGQEGQAAEAIRDFQKALQLRPYYVTALVNLGNLYRRQGAPTEAEDLLRRALRAEPENAEAHYSLGMFYAQQGRMEPALQLLEKAVELRPDYADALNNLGVVLARAGRAADAEERFQACIRVAPQFDQAYLNLARLYAMMNDTQKAREVLLALLRLQPQHKLARQTLEMLH